MKAVLSYRLLFAVVLLFAFGAVGFAQSKVQKPDKTTRGDGKKNQRPPEQTEEQRKQQEEQRRLEEEAKNAERDDDPVTIKTNIVSVDAVVYDKKSGNIITGLKRENFAIFENGVKQEIAQFATPEAPITVTLLVEYSRWSEVFGAYASRGFEPGKFEVVRPVAFSFKNLSNRPTITRRSSRSICARRRSPTLRTIRIACARPSICF